jgi:hypothetical protein
MKKIKMVLLALLSLVTTSVFSQSYDKTSMMEIGTWNTYTREWDWESPVIIDFIIKINGKKIYINDAAKTVITVYGESQIDKSYNDQGERYVCNTWDAYDEKNRKCKFMMSYIPGKSLMVYLVIYSDIALRYYCPQNDSL